MDGNRLNTVHGLDKLQLLDTLSMRSQDASFVAIFEQHVHARSLYLSSNNVPSLVLPHSCHSVQNLELASCGLQELSPDFGLKFPNLRTLNASFNAIKDLRPLLNITRLETLHVPGNRISRLRKTIATLARMQHLRNFDARDNPFTLGFYPPPATAAALSECNAHSLVRSPSPSEDHESETETQIQQRAAKLYLLPLADPMVDAQHCGRLDDEAKMRRRVYELLLSQSSRSLEALDGLALNRKRVITRDGLWNRLVELGVMKKSQHGGIRVNTPMCELEV